MLLSATLASAAMACAGPEPRAPAQGPSLAPSPTPSGGFGGGEPCPDIDEGFGCRSSLEGDFDGDGAEDEARVSARTRADGYPRSWRLELRLSTGERIDADPRWWPGSTVGKPPEGADWWSGYPQTVAVFDLEGDGRDEIFVKVIEHILHGGSVPDHAIFTLRQGRLLPLRGEDKEIFIVPLGGVSYFGHGMRCKDTTGDGRRELVVLRVENAATTSPDWSRRYYELRGTTLRLIDRKEGTITREGFPDPDVDAFYRLRCAGAEVRLW